MLQKEVEVILIFNKVLLEVLGYMWISLSRIGIFKVASQKRNTLRLLQIPREVISLESRFQYRLLISNVIYRGGASEN